MGGTQSLLKKGEIVNWYLESNGNQYIHALGNGYILHGQVAKRDQKEGEDHTTLITKDKVIGTIGSTKCTESCMYFSKVQHTDNGEYIFTFKNGASLNYARAYTGMSLTMASTSTIIDLALTQLTDPQSRVVLNDMKTRYDPEPEPVRNATDTTTITVGDAILKFGGGKIENPETGRMVQVGGKTGTHVIKHASKKI